MNLWAPSVSLSIGTALSTAFILGIIHGITPDEHTWPITYSYAISGYSTKRGLMAGISFSLAFTIQRAFASELAYLTFDHWLTGYTFFNYYIYLVVGTVMWIGGHYINGGHVFHFWKPKSSPTNPDDTIGLRDPRPWMPLVHGFIAGWGVGAFAIIIYTVLAPAMVSPVLGWLPGALFGLGTTFTQAVLGGFIGLLAQRMKLPPSIIRRIALITAGRTLRWGGIVFVLGGVFGLTEPHWAEWGINTGLRIHNLAHLGLAFMLVMIVVMLIGVGSLAQQIFHWKHHLQDTDHPP